MSRCLLSLVVLLFCSPAIAADPVGTAHVYKTVGDRELKLYVVTPEEAGTQRPAIVLFHGGGWTGGQPTQFNDFAVQLAERGIVAVQVEYRLLDRKNQDPPIICIQDAKSAMRWVFNSAATGLARRPARSASHAVVAATSSAPPSVRSLPYRG